MRKLALGGLAAFFALGAFVARAEDDKKDGTITVYRPYSKLDEIFDEKGGVFLPAKELQKLIDQLEAIKKQPLGAQAVETPPPAPFVHTKSTYKGSADESVAKFEGIFEFEVLEKKKWVEIPLGLGPEISLEEAKTADGKRAIVRPTKEGGYTLLVQGGGPLTVTAKFTAPIRKDRPGQRSFEIRLARAALCSFEVEFPEPGLKVDVTPSLGVTSNAEAAGGKTTVKAFLGSGDAPVTVTWYPKPKEITKGVEKPVVFSDLGMALRLDEGVAKAFIQARYTVEQAPTDTFKLMIPKDWKVFDVQAEGKREHEVTETTNAQVLRVAFHERLRAATLSFRLERARDDQAKFDFPVVKTLEVERETGLVAAASSSFLKLEAGKVTGLSQVDPSEIPAQISTELRKEEGDRVPLGFRFLKNDYKLELTTAKVEPEVEGKVYSLATVKDEEIAYYATIVYEIKKRGIFGVKIKLPAGLTNVDCGDETTVKSAVPRAATAAEKWDGQILDVDFARQARPGPFVLRLTGTIARKDAKLGMPILALDGVVKETGVLAMAAQKHLKLTTAGQPTGLIAVAVGELAGLQFPYATQENEELVFGFKYGKPGASANVDIAKRDPKVSATVETIANADLDRIKVDGDIRYKVEFAGIDHLKIRCPKELNTDKEFVLTADGASIKERKCSEADKDGRVTWDVELQSKREGNFKIHFHYEIKLDMSAGAQRDVTLHEIEAVDKDSRETGDIALIKHENLVISEGKTDGLETRAMRELPEALSKLNGFRGYHYVQHPWTLELHVIKYDFQAPLGKIIEHEHLDEVVLRDGTMQCEAWIKLRNNQSQFLRVLIPVGAEVFSPVLVGGKEVTPSKFVVAGKEQSGVDIMLPEETRRGDQAVLVRMRYAFKKERSLGFMGSLTLDAPTFPTDDAGAAGTGVPVARFTRNVWLPDKVCYTDFDTDMTTHFERGGLFDGAKKAIFQHMREEEGAAAAEQAVHDIHSLATSATGAYPPLEHPTRGQSGAGPRLFEKLDGQASLRVVFASWPALYGLGVLALAAVVALGAFMESKKLLSPVAYFAISAGTTFFLAVIASRSYEPFLTTAFTGSLGIGGFWFLRACWRELTVERHKRHLEALAREAEVAKARASAAEAESRAAQGRTAPAPAAPAAPKGGSPAEGQGGERIGFDESLGRQTPPQA